MPKTREPVRRPSRRLRCAVYTRKSSDEGLEQAFNSLDAQREACAAFVLSQKHEGWSVLPTLYDDGGFSGGTLERPALQRLLADIADAKVDVVVVYKIDRLTRSLFDFAKIVEVFEARGVSFVSITQQFNFSRAGQPPPNMVAYNCAKAGIEALTRTLALEGRDLGIRVNAIAPGLVDTVSNIAAMKPKDLKRWTKREDIAETVLFLASPAASGITGQVVAVTGWGL